MTSIEERLIRIEAKLDVLLGKQHQQPQNQNPPNIMKELLSFTPKQHAVIQMIWGNADTETMADIMKVSISTIKVHIRGIMRKTGFKSRAQIAMMAEELLAVDASVYLRTAGIPNDWYSNRRNYEDYTSMLREKVR